MSFQSLTASSAFTAAVQAMEQDLPATSDQFSLSISLFALVQGLMPIAWSAISEIKGRKARLLFCILMMPISHDVME
jgi:MFS family permease